MSRSLLSVFSCFGIGRNDSSAENNETDVNQPVDGEGVDERRRRSTRKYFETIWKSEESVRCLLTQLEYFSTASGFSFKKNDSLNKILLLRYVRKIDSWGPRIDYHVIKSILMTSEICK